MHKPDQDLIKLL